MLLDESNAGQKEKWKHENTLYPGAYYAWFSSCQHHQLRLWPNLERAGITLGPQRAAVSLPFPARSPDPSIWIQPVPSQHLARNLFSNQTPSHGRHLVQHWHPDQQPKFNSCAITIQPPLAVTSASGQPYWIEGEGHRKESPRSELADFVIDGWLECGES